MKRALALALVIGACARAPQAGPARAPRVGPEPRSAPASAALLRSTGELRAALAGEERDLWLAPGTYDGPLAIRRSVTLHGTEGVVLDGAHRGTVVTIDASDVAIEDVVVRGSGGRHTAEDAGIKAKGERVALRGVRVEDSLFGITLEACRACTVERASVSGARGDEELRGDGIKLWEAHDSTVRSTVVEAGRDVVVWYTRRAALDDVLVAGGRYGAHFMYAHDCVVRGSRFERNVVGIFVMYSSGIRVEDTILAGARGAAGMGVGFKDSDAIELRRNAIVANTTGAFIDNTPRVPETPVVFEDDVFALNQIALSVHTDGAGLAFRRDDFKDNADLVTITSGGELAAKFDGNYFTDYQGYDLDGDGVGDVPYEVKLLSRELTDTRPSLRLFQGTLALGAVDAVARAVPVLAAKRVLADPHPRMEAMR